ncbi:2-hydroxyacid dehydrogenase [Muriicola sp.]|uniref:2-hydroxyacid dehydrogenase n=1 Tax=Muriicola sp. TaxID=2020856 RepID=UPI003C74447B
MAIVLIRQDGKLDLWKNAFLGQYPDLPVFHYEEPHSTEEVTMAIVWKHPEGSLTHYPNLQCIASFGAGVDFIFEDNTRPKNVTITRVIDPALAADMSEYVLGVILMYLKNLDTYRQDQANKSWRPKAYTRIADHTIGIMGAGTLGITLANSLLPLGFKVVGWSREAKEVENFKIYHGQGGKTNFLRQSTILVCLLPLTDATKEILDKETLSQLPKGAYLINVARGGHLAENQLIPLIDSGHLSGACLDVFQQEPLEEGHPFWDHPKIKITPHVASVSDPASVVHQLVENYYRLEKKVPLVNTVDPSRGY